MIQTWFGKLALGAVLLVTTFLPANGAHNQNGKNCGGLHAAIRAQVVPSDPKYTRPSFVMLSLILLNDSDAPIGTSEGNWRIVIDGDELGNSDEIFGNGPGPVGGWGVLKPGESYEFGKSLELSKYFPVAREYKVSWKGDGFQSSTIAVEVKTAP